MSPDIPALQHDMYSTSTWI